MIRASILLILLLFSPSVHAQPSDRVIADGDTDLPAVFEKNQMELADSYYSSKAGTLYELVNGSTYYPYHYRSVHKPLLFYEKSRIASVTVKGRKYDNIILQYDTFTDELIYPEIENSHNLRLYQISLNKDIIESFTLNFHDDTLNFRLLNSADLSGSDLRPGFYEIVYDGESQYIVRHRSVIHQRNGINEYFYSPSGYVKAGGQYFKIKSNRQFIRLFGERSDEMRKILTGNRTNVRKAGRQQIINTLRLFDSSQKS